MWKVKEPLAQDRRTTIQMTTEGMDIGHARTYLYSDRGYE